VPRSHLLAGSVDPASNLNIGVTESLLNFDDFYPTDGSLRAASTFESTRAIPTSSDRINPVLFDLPPPSTVSLSISPYFAAPTMASYPEGSLLPPLYLAEPAPPQPIEPAADASPVKTTTHEHRCTSCQPAAFFSSTGARQRHRNQVYLSSCEIGLPDC